MKKTIVIGAGASGLFTAIKASEKGNEVLVLEKNEKCGKKIYITGKGRCNLSNNTDSNTFLENVVNNHKFLYGAINNFSPSDTISFFENNGLKLKTERGNRVFPESDKASDVTKTLEKICQKFGVKFLFNTEVEKILTENNAVIGVLIKGGKKIKCDSVVVCTGGLSYPLTGSTGDGYMFAKSVGHTVIDTKPSLVGIELIGDYYKDFQGISLKNVRLSAFNNDKKIFSEQGEMLFTHFGVSGPLILTLSALINRLDLKSLLLSIDFKPALSYETLEKRIIKEFSFNSTKEIKNVMRSLLPKNLIDEVLKRSEIKKDTVCNAITVEKRDKLIKNLKNFTMKVKNLRPIDEAVITSGGVSVKEINPKTMESKIISGLFFAGEVLDVDAFTGGFNLQIAFSTGYTAGENC
ncbi:MAG: NAD(P)/FAD-dependent oxidoreductase [Clostridia bacterium]|nr:NAD(P)/FAD-dependent oxidoreductase [Clostridia bacterium]